MATGEAAEVVTVDAVKVEAVKVQDEEAVKVRDKAKVLEKSIQGTRQPDMKTCPHTSPVDAIGVLERLHISVRNQGPVPGRITGSPKEINEISASLKQKKTNHRIRLYMTFFIVTSQK